jgi:hypothetical protein
VDNELDGEDMLELTVQDLGSVLGFDRPKALWNVIHGGCPRPACFDTHKVFFVSCAIVQFLHANWILLGV